MEINQLLMLMVTKNASDLFIVAGKEPCIKVDGIVEPISRAKLSTQQTMEMVTSVMSPQQRETFFQTKECNFAIHDGDLGRFRVSAYIQRDSAGMVLRHISYKVPTVAELNLPNCLNDFSMIKRGLILLVGATGTGKSSSLAAMVKYRNENSKGHIITIEDPIEYLHPHAGCIISQREIGIDTESYEVALTNTLRQAPDVILIGEIRTRETMQHAIMFAETGHLCLSTLHANNANQALERIMHFFPEETHSQMLMDLSLNLRCIIAQQLIQRSDGKGRYPAVEILVSTPLIADLIRKGDIQKLKEVMKNSREQGMQTFDQALFDLYTTGKITYEDALHSADSKNEVRLMIKLGGGREYQANPSLALDGEEPSLLDE